MAEQHAQMFQALRPHVLKRLVEARGSIDHGFARIPEDTIRIQFDLILDKMSAYLATEDTTQYEGFASRYFALRVGEGFTHENLIHSLIAIGDVVVQVARRHLDASPKCDDFIRAVVRMNLEHAQMLVRFLAEDLTAREAQREVVRTSA